MKTTFRFPVMLLCIMAVLVIAGGICTGVAQAESCSAESNAAAKVVSAQKPFFETWDEDMLSCHIMVAMDGSVLLFEQQRPEGEVGYVVVKRSEDGGKTWGPEILF